MKDKPLITVYVALDVILVFLPVVFFAIFLFACILSVGKDDTAFSFAGLCLMMSFPYVMGAIVMLGGWCRARRFGTTQEFLQQAKRSWTKGGIILIGTFLTFGTIKLSLLEVFDEGALNIFRLLLMFGGPIMIGLLTLLALSESEDD